MNDSASDWRGSSTPGKKVLPRLCEGDSLKGRSAATWFQKRLPAFSSRCTRAMSCWQRMLKIQKCGMWESEILWGGSGLFVRRGIHATGGAVQAEEHVCSR